MSKNTDLGNLVNGLFVSSTRNVGIGMSTPANAVVVDKGTATASYLQFTAGTTTGQLATDGFEVGIDASGNGIISQQENLPLMIYTNSAERMRINAVGNIGIGVIPSSWSVGKALELGNLGNGLWNASAADTRLMTNVYFNGGFFYGSNGVASIMETGDGFIWRTAPLGTANASATFTERMRITSAGNVGIGTDSPLNVTTNRTSVTINGTSTSILSFGSGGVGKAYIYNDGTNLETFSAGALIYNTAGSERMRITSGGNVLIGTTTDNGYKLNVSGSIYASGGIVSNSSVYGVGGIGSQGNIVIDYGYAFGLNSNTQNSANAWNFYVSSSFSNNIRFFYGGSGVGSGTAKAQIDTSGNYSALSDINKKKDIALSTLGLTEVMQLKPSTFKFKDDEKQEEQIGFIAQEVKDIIPHAYYEDLEGEDKFIGLNQTAFIPVLVKAIQELKAEIDILKNK